MICESCGEPIEIAEVNVFNYDGSDSWVKVPLIQTGNNAVIIDTDRNFCGYELSDGEANECIRCPVCKGQLFKDDEIQIYDIVRVVKFSKEREQN